MKYSLELALLGILMILMICVAVLHLLGKIYEWKINRTAGKIRKRQERIRMIREYRKGKP